jgi:hypothetical protein
VKYEKKFQHYVPASYLAAWCDPSAPRGQKYVWRFDRNSHLGRPKGPHKIFGETDFYTRFSRDGKRDVGIENALSAIEAQFARVRNKVLSKNEWPKREDLAYLVLSAMLLRFRTKAQRDSDREQWRGVKETGDLLLASTEEVSPGGTSPHFRSDPSVPTMSHREVKRIADQPIQELLLPKLEVYEPIFRSMDAAMIVTDDRLGFITSDNPCVVVDPTIHRRPPMYRQASLLSRNVEVTLPISPRMALYLNRGRLNGYLECDSSQVDEINWRTCRYSYEYFVVQRHEVRECWFTKRPMPEDAWENVTDAEEGVAPESAT